MLKNIKYRLIGTLNRALDTMIEMQKSDLQNACPVRLSALA